MSTFGWAAAFGSATGNAVQDVFRKKVVGAGLDTLEAVAALSVVAAAVSLSWSVVSGGVPDVVTAEMWVGSIATSIGKVGAQYFYIKAVNMAPLSQTVPFLALNPVILLFLGILWFDETPTMRGVIGTILVLFGAYILSLSMKMINAERRAKKDLDEEDEHTGESQSIERGNYDDIDFSADLQIQGLSANQRKSKDPKLLRSGSLSETLKELVPTNLVRLFKENEAMWYMCFVCMIWTYTAAFEKWTLRGTSISPIFFVGMQRVFQSFPTIAASTYARPEWIDLMFVNLPTLICAAIAETATAVLYYVALDYIFVSYVVAIKRGYGMFLSVLIGCFYYKEKLNEYGKTAVFVMIVGMLMIVFSSQSTKIFLSPASRNI